MSENDTKAPDDEAGEDANFDAIEAELAAEEAAEARDDEPRAATRSIGTVSIAWGALFLALVGVAGVGYVILDDSSENQVLDDARIAVDNLRADLDRANSTIESLRAEVYDAQSAVGSAGDDNASLERELEQLERDIMERAELLESLPPRMSSIERTVAALEGVSVEARNTYLVAEAEYYMQIANAQLQLAGNPELASLALSQADDRLLTLGDPGLTDTRRALADEIAALEAMERPDLAGAILTLGSLSRVVDSLPLRPLGLAAEDEETSPEDSEEPSGLSRAWSSFKGTLSGLGDYSAPGIEDAPLLTPDAEPLLRANLSLMLQAARLALLKSEQAAFEQSLDDADAWLGAYFDLDSAQVSSARATILEVRENYAAIAPPDIATSLRLLRQYKALSGLTE
jgi:uroporphyrin-3 C-methyltransferase